MSFWSFHPSQKEIFDCLVEWVLSCGSWHRNWMSNLKENDDLSSYSVSCFTQMKTHLSFFIFFVSSRVWVGWWRLGWNSATTPGANGGEGESHLKISLLDWSRPTGSTRTTSVWQETVNPTARVQKKKKKKHWWLVGVALGESVKLYYYYWS